MTYTSASQLETTQLCARKWWLNNVAKLPKIERADSLVFGEALHGCAERYLLGEEPFNDGWSDGLTPQDAVLIRLLISKAIEAGYLERRPGGVTEEEFKIRIDEETTLIGYKDYSTKDRVEDHKTSKSARYLKSAKSLKENIQMMIYAKDLLDKAVARGELIGAITLCHNQYLRDYDDPAVRRVEVEVFPEEINTFWRETILPLIQKQKELARIENPFEIPEPPPSACRAFGGCERLAICSGQETVEEHRKRLTPKPKPMSEIKATNPSDFLAQRAAKAAAAGAPAINPPLPAAPAPAAQAPAAAPPWASPTCPMCSKGKTPGFSSKGTPCRICISVTKGSTEGFSWEANADGTVSWWRGEKVVAQSTPVTAPVADAGAKKVYGADDLYAELKRAGDEAAIVALATKGKQVLGEGTPETALFLAAIEKRLEDLPPEPVAEAVPEVLPVVEPPKVEAPKPPKAEKPKKVEGFTLLVGAAPLRGFEKAVFAEEVLGADYWNDPNVFDRRGKIRTNAPAMAADLAAKGAVIVQRGRDPDVDNLISSLLPLAARVVQGTIQ